MNVSPRSRSRLKGAVGLLLATIVGLFGAGAVLPATAGATTGIATYSASLTQPGALATSFGSTDGWAVAVSSTRVFNITHHQPTLQVACHNEIDGSLCWPGMETKTVTDGVHNFATSVGAGMYLNQTTGHLYVFADETDGTGADTTAGVACIDTNLPATATGEQIFCGFTALSAPGDAPIALYPGLTAPVVIGNSWYSFNEVAGVGTAAGSGTENTLLCFNVATGTACPRNGYVVPLNGTIDGSFGTAPPIGSAGTDVFIPVQATVSGNATTELGCFDTVTQAGCTGTWPVTIGNVAGSPFPLLNASGSAVGVCVPIAAVPCFSFTGASTTTPINLKHVIGATNTANGPAVVIGSRVYVANSNSNAVECFDYTTTSSCPNFPMALHHLSLLYTVNTDPDRPTCIWVNADHGSAQIQNFDAITGGACEPGPIRVLASSFVVSNSTCQPLSYVSLQITSPMRSTYSSATVQFATATGTPLDIPSQSVDSFGVANLSGLNFASAPLPQFIVTLAGETAPPTSVTLHLTWTASDEPDCSTGGQTVTTHPGYWLVASDGGIFNYGTAQFYGSAGNIHLNRPIVGMSLVPSDKGYWLIASDGGIFSYGSAPFYGSMGKKHLNMPIVGMASTPSGKGYWLVASDGGIFAFGDARFYGSTGNIHLNEPIVGMAATPDGGGYWLVASDGGVFAYGDAQYYGSAGSIHLNKPIVGIAANPLGGGYWIVASDGGIFNYGSSKFYGSAGNIALNKPIVGLAPTFDGKGYWLAASDGGIFNYGDAGYAGSAGNIVLNKPIVAIGS